MLKSLKCHFASGSTISMLAFATFLKEEKALILNKSEIPKYVENIHQLQKPYKSFLIFYSIREGQF